MIYVEVDGVILTTAGQQSTLVAYRPDSDLHTWRVRGDIPAQLDIIETGEQYTFNIYSVPGPTDGLFLRLVSLGRKAKAAQAPAAPPVRKRAKISALGELRFTVTDTANNEPCVAFVTRQVTAIP